MSGDNNSTIVSEVDALALRLYLAIRECQYREIEQIVDAGREKGLLSVTDMDGNTFLLLVVDLIQRMAMRELVDIPSVDSSSHFIRKVYSYIVAYKIFHLIITCFFPSFFLDCSRFKEEIFPR